MHLNMVQRAECVQRAISIITENTAVPLESILLHPHRVRYWILLTDSCTAGLSTCGNSSGSGSVGVGVDCMRVTDGCNTLVMRHLSCPVVSVTHSTSLSSSEKSTDVSSYLKFSAQELVPWEAVTDLALRVSALSDLSTPYDEDDTIAPSSSAATRRSTYKQRYLASAKRRRLQCGLDVSNLSRSLTADINESDTTWMLLGASMIAEQLTSALTRPYSDDSAASHTDITAAAAAAGSDLNVLRGRTYQFPRVYSAGYLWDVFYPHMLILLRAPALAASEGLSLMGHLGERAVAPFIECGLDLVLYTLSINTLIYSYIQYSKYKRTYPSSLPLMTAETLLI